MDTKNCFQARLLRTRVAKRLSQSALAKAVGITPAQISRYEAGENFPRPHIVAQLAKALGVEAEWLTGTASEDLAPPPYAAIDMSGDSGFADRLRQARIASELSQADLAVAAGIASAQISRYEAGRNYPRPHIIAKLAKALGVTPEWLTEEEQTGSSPSPAQEELLGSKQEFTFQPSANSLEKLQALSVLTGKTPDELVQQMFEELEVTLHGSFLKSIHGTMPAAQGQLTLRPTSPIIRVAPDGTTQEITLEELAKAVASEIQKKPD